MNAGLSKVSVLHSDDRVSADLLYMLIVENCLQICIENKLISILSDLEKHPD